MAPRIALLGFSIECNRFAPGRHRSRLLSPAPCSPARRCWQKRAPPLHACWANLPRVPRRPCDAGRGHGKPVPILLAMAEPTAQWTRGFFDSLMRQWEAGLRGAGNLDGVYACCMALA